MNITPKQISLLNAIKEFINSNGFAPTQRELRDILGYKHKKSVADKLDALEGNGLISRLAFMRRSIVVNQGA